MNLPEEYLSEMKQLLKDDFRNYTESLSMPSFNGLRVNTSKISVEDFLKISPFHLEPVPWCKEGFYYQEEDRPSTHPYYHAGLYYLQEPSAMSPGAFLPVEPDDVVLDGCAAPGGKTTQLACRLSKGLLVSNDISASRQQATLKNVERHGFQNVWVTSSDISAFTQDTFDKILLDAPCSGEGMFRKDPSLISSWVSRNHEYYRPIQKELIDKAAFLLKDGGMILYSTCTFNPKENEEVIQYALTEHPELSLVKINKHPLFADGISGLEECARLYPFRLNGEGHFMALLQKQGQSKKAEDIIYPSFENEAVERFVSLINRDYSKESIFCIGEKVYHSNHRIDTSGIMTLRSGLLLGTLKKNRFEPSQHLAMSLKAEQFSQTVNLSAADERTERYLRGETITYETPYRGWVLVCVDGYPLGFAKAEGNKLKNKIEAGHRKL
ncbi:MAG: RsmB/NOP family class I SAM-dependent RNA methyltransferase [Erysipelotrichaceae bacterium]|nr:RsmB/NOP family class I SAM-dependent RNA methyltransferase [Erysipelotrichaceae bacterium]